MFIAFELKDWIIQEDGHKLLPVDETITEDKNQFNMMTKMVPISRVI